VQEVGAGPQENEESDGDNNESSAQSHDGEAENLLLCADPLPALAAEGGGHLVVDARDDSAVERDVLFDGADVEAALAMIDDPVPLVNPAASADAAGVPLVHPAAPPRVPADVFVVLPGLGGMFRTYATTQKVVMHCPHHDHCVLTRTLKTSPLASRAGQGKPMALLYAWSKFCPPGLSAWQHVHEFVPTAVQRREARIELLASPLPEITALLGKERLPLPGEPLEPDHVP
jgi:hypothetical protein